MKTITAHFAPIDIEINRVTFRITPKATMTAAKDEVKGMPLPHYVYMFEVQRLDREGTTPLKFEYHGGFEEWARSKPYMPPIRMLSIFADFVIDAGLSISRKPEDLIEAWEFDTDMANKTWWMFEARRNALKEHFLMTTDQILGIANAFHFLMVDGRLAELLDEKKGVGRNE